MGRRTPSRLRGGGPWFLGAVSVRGHAGIGEQPVELRLTPARGLTIVSAPNGTGKTSFVDGLRLGLGAALSSDQGVLAGNIHWAQRLITATVTTGARDVNIVSDGSGVKWAEAAGDPAAIPSEWRDAFARYLPVLLHHELSPVIENPGGKLHDFLKAGLALDVLDRLRTAAPQGTVVRGSGFAARFDGDTSKLPPEVCWTLQELVAAPHLSEKSSRHWIILLQYEDVIRSRLSELGLTVEISHEHRHAFTRQADDPSPHSRAILRAKTLSLAASALALHLYQVYLLSPDEPVVETADLLDHMMAYRPPSDNDEVNFQKRIRAAITSLDEAGLIKPVKGTERYVINSVITSVLTADSITGLEQRYRAIASGAPVTADATSSDGEGPGDA